MGLRAVVHAVDYATGETPRAQDHACMQASTPSGVAQGLCIALCTKQSPVQLLPPPFEACTHPSRLVGTGTMQGASHESPGPGLSLAWPFC